MRVRGEYGIGIGGRKESPSSFVREVSLPSNPLGVHLHGKDVKLIVGIVVGSIGSEFVQALLPYKTFQWGDVVVSSPSRSSRETPRDS